MDLDSLRKRYKRLAQNGLFSPTSHKAAVSMGKKANKDNVSLSDIPGTMRRIAKQKRAAKAKSKSSSDELAL